MRVVNQVFEDAAIGDAVTARALGSQRRELYLKNLERRSLHPDPLQMGEHDAIHFIAGNAAIARQGQQTPDIGSGE